MIKIERPITNLYEFEQALETAELTAIERQIIEYIRFIGVFNQPMIVNALSIKSKPPVLSTLCGACRKIGSHMPEHFNDIRTWSKTVNSDGIRWDGNLICSITWNIDGEKLCPEAGTAQFHNFAVHKELFQGFQ